MNTENFSKMAQFIFYLRKEKKLTQSELAQQLGVTDKAVSKWERGLSCPDISILSKLSSILGVTTDELLNGEKAQPFIFEAYPAAETAVRNGSEAAKNVIVRNTRLKFAARVFIVSLLSILIIAGCNWMIDRDNLSFILPVNITAIVWIAGIAGAFVAGKNKMAFLLLCGFVIFITTFYYSSLNQTAARENNANGILFQVVYLPHYTMILGMFIISIAVTAASFLIYKKRITADIVFMLITISITVIILSALTVTSIVDYVDINGFGVNSKFIMLLILTFLIDCISLTLSARYYKQKIQ